jgi:hypothetical protein
MGLASSGGRKEAAMTDVLSRCARLSAVALVLGVVTVASCDRLMSTRIGKIAARPADYQGKDVTIVGTVSERIDIPSLKCYVLSDGKDSIGVVTKGRLPLVGDRVRAKGRVQQSFAIGSRKLLVIIEAAKPTPTRPKNPAVPKGGPG